MKNMAKLLVIVLITCLGSINIKAQMVVSYSDESIDVCLLDPHHACHLCPDAFINASGDITIVYQEGNCVSIDTDDFIPGQTLVGWINLEWGNCSSDDQCVGGGVDPYSYEFVVPCKTDTTTLTEISCLSAGQEIKKFFNQYGCDSVVIITYEYTPPQIDSSLVEICAGEFVSGEQIEEDFVLRDTIISQVTDCDSLIEITFYQILPLSEEYQDSIVCIGSIIDGIVINQDTILIDTLLNEYGCSHFLSTYVNVNEVDVDVEQFPACGEETSMEIYPISGVAPFDINVFDTTGSEISNWGFDSAQNISVLVTDSLGCTWQESSFIDVWSFPTIDLGDDIEVEMGEIFSIEADSYYDHEVSWTHSFPFEVAISDSNIQGTVMNPGSFQIAVNVADEYGCESTDEINVRVLSNHNVYFPNAFTPNNNGANDTFFPLSGASVSEVVALEVYDRWGNNLFSGENFQPNDPLFGWDGTYRGKRMNPGVYVWHAQIRFIDGVVQSFKGDVTIPN